MKKNNLYRFKIALLAVLATNLQFAGAQNFRVEITQADAHDYVCDVGKIADDLTARDLGGRSANFWTKTMRGGKFQAIDAVSVRVASSSPNAARNELFSFYQKNASLVRGTFPDQGRQPIDRVVKSCVVDPSSTRDVKIQPVSKDKYKILTRDRDHLMKFFALSSTKLTDEQIVSLTNPTALPPIDAFDRKAFYQKEGKRVSEEMAAMDKGPFILEAELHLKPYDFEKGGFEISNIAADAEAFKYSYDMYARVSPKKPAYKLSAGPGLTFYKPKTMEESKKIESARAKGELSLHAFVQPVRAWLNGDTPEIDGVVSGAEVRGKTGEVLFSLPAK